MNDMHFHCINCREDQWLDEDTPCCSFCGSSNLWEIVIEDEPAEISEDSPGEIA